MRSPFNIGFVCRLSKVQKSELAPVGVTIVFNGAVTFLPLPRNEALATFKKLSTAHKYNEHREYLQGVCNEGITEAD